MELTHTREYGSLTKTLDVKCFGAPQITLNRAPITSLLSRKALALFLYLAVTGGPHSRDELADLLWSEQSNQVARNNLRYLLPELRKAVGDYLLITPHAITFVHSQPYGLDCTHFRKTLAQGLDTVPTAELQTTLALYTDDFLAGFHLRNAPVFEAWVASQQTELQMLAVKGLLHLAERYYLAGNDLEGIMTTQRLLSLEPWHEAGHRLQMKLLMLQGQRSMALAQYQQLQKMLADELATEPEAETQQLYAMISSGRFGPATEHLPASPATVAVTTQAASHSSLLPATPPPPAAEAPAWSNSNLPGQLTPFFGREQEIADLYAQLYQDDHRLITLTGEGGIGKTRLALAVAQAIVETKFGLLDLASPIRPNSNRKTAHQQFADGIWFVPLSGLRAGPDLPEQLAIAIAQAMNFSFSTTSALIAQLLAYLRNKRLLLILDNFEQLTIGAAFILELLQKTTGVKLLITSRTILNLQAEYQWAVTGLPTPTSDQVKSATVAELLHYSSISLFVERARRVQRHFQLDELNRHTVCHICRLLHGLPLGIELAAAQLRFYTCATIRQTLATSAITLTTNYYDVPPRHRSLAMVLADSWSLLTTEAQTVLARLSSFQGSFTVDAGITVAQTSPILLNNLCDHSLLQQNTSQRYLLHEFVRQFAAEKLKLAGSEEACATAERHAHYYLTLPQIYEKAFQGPTPQVAIAAIQQELVNIEHAWCWGVAQQESTLLAHCCLGLFEFYYCTNLLEKGKQIFAAAIAMIQQQVTETTAVAKANQLEVDLATLLYVQGHLLIAQNAYADALCLAQQIVTLADKQKVPELVAKGTYLWGLGASALGEYAQAEQQLTAALTLARTIDQPGLTALTLARLARLAEFRANYTVAQQYGAEALALSRTTANLMAESLSLTTLGIIYQRLGDFTQAKTCWETALALNEQSGITASRAALLLNLGTISDNLGNYAAAQRYYQAALQLSRDNGIAQLEAEVLGNLGISADYIGDYAAALNYSQESLQLWRHLGITGRLPIVLVNLGLHAHHLGDPKAAQLYGQQALTLSQQNNNRHLQSYAWTILGHAATMLEEFVAAEAAYTEAIRLAHGLAIPLMTIEPLAGLVRIGLARQVAYPLIQPYLEDIIDFLTRNGGDGLEEPFRVYLTCYEGLLAMGDSRANPFLETTYTLLQKRVAQIDDPVLRGSFLENVEANRKLCTVAQFVKL